MSEQHGWLIDTVPSERFPVYTRLNANDVLPDPITPLGASFCWIPHIIPGWAAGYVALDAFTPTELAQEDMAPVAGFFYGYLYINQSNVRVVGIRAGIGWQAIDAAFFSTDSPPHEERPEDVNEELSAKMGARTQWALTTTTFPELEEEREIAERIRASRPDLAALSPAALVMYARSLMPFERLCWRSETIGSNQAATGPAVLGQLLGQADPSLIVKVIGQAGDVDSAAPSFALWDLSRTVRADAGLMKVFDEGVPGLLDRLDGGHAEFLAQFHRFLRDFGYRGPSEWDIGADSWETRPELALGLVDRLRHLGDEASPASRQGDQERERTEATAKALEILGDNAEALATFELAVGSARRFGAWRERAKTNCIKVLHEARMALTELARRLHADGHLESPQQLFMATDDELDILIAQPEALKERLADRERNWHDLAGLDIPTFLDSRQGVPALADIPRKTEVEVEVAKPGDVLQGGPASAGVARGIARVIHDTAAISDFQPGEVLIAPQTDPSWTPLFMVSSAVVVDVGAMGSHAMIVSRELGIPCAAGVTNATRRIPTGAEVEVDGSTGRVTVISVPEREAALT
ncbi:PEP-utilizing enzyme [Geodermatophilus sp. URMC 64]